MSVGRTTQWYLTSDHAGQYYLERAYTMLTLQVWGPFSWHRKEQRRETIMQSPKKDDCLARMRKLIVHERPTERTGLESYNPDGTQDHGW